MTASSIEPAAAAAVEWDAVVVGTGMGGGTAGYELARLGRKVLFLEKGESVPGRPPPPVDPADERAARLALGWWPDRLRAAAGSGVADFHAPLGCGLGGSTALYAAALERLSPRDFTPRSSFAAIGESTLPEAWPVGYEEMQPHYARAEALFRVRGTPDPLERGQAPALEAPPPLSARDRHLEQAFRELGLHPYRVHVGCAFVPGCSGCAAGPCERGCKSDAATICVLPAASNHGAAVLTGCEVTRIEASGDRVAGVRCRVQGGEFAIRARAVVLAAGAYMSPLLLLRSASEEWPGGLANRSGLVGRNLMMHASDFFAVAPRGRHSDEGPKKSLALNDFYWVDGEKLGTFQSAGVSVDIGQIMQYIRDSAERAPDGWRRLLRPHPLWWRKLTSPAVRLAALAAFHLYNFRQAALWASVIEDLPYSENRVLPDPSAPGGLRIEYRYRDELRRRVRSFRARVRQALHPHRVMLLSGDDNLNYGHPCGTCRFGDDPRTSVLDRDNRAHGLENLYVVDASFFPSSGGTNPSLTIAANALRVAGVLHSRL